MSLITDVNSFADLVSLSLFFFLSPQRKLWIFWWELSHVTLTYRDLELKHLCNREQYRHCGSALFNLQRFVERFVGNVTGFCKKLRLILQLGHTNHTKIVVLMMSCLMSKQWTRYKEMKQSIYVVISASGT